MGIGREKVFLAFVLRLSHTSWPQCWELVPGAFHLQGEKLLGSAVYTGKDFIEGKKAQGTSLACLHPRLQLHGAALGTKPAWKKEKEEIF